MVIEEMTRDASIDFVANKRFGRLACARDGQPYITPIYFAHANNYLYAFATIGQKIEWLRLNPLVCIEADEMESPRKWCSVILTGRYEELPDTPLNEESRKLAEGLNGIAAASAIIVSNGLPSCLAVQATRTRRRLPEVGGAARVIDRNSRRFRVELEPYFRCIDRVECSLLGLRAIRRRRMHI